MSDSLGRHRAASFAPVTPRQATLSRQFQTCLRQRPSFTVVWIKTLASARKTQRRWYAGAVAVLLATVSFGAEIPALLEYRIGDQAEVDIVTPVPLVVFDPAQTEALRQAEIQRVEPVFRHFPGVAVQAESSLKSAFSNTQARFTAGLEKVFGHPLPLLNDEFGQPQYADYVKSFRDQPAGFPLTSQLGELWALGDSGEIVLNRQLARLQPWTNAFVRSDTLPGNEKLASPMLRLVTQASPGTPLTLAAAERQGRIIASTNVLTLSALRQIIERSAPAAERAEARYVSSFVQPNCVFDEALTRQSRARRTEAINVADRYEAGQVIVKQGETVTERTKLALDELQTRTAPSRIQANADLERSRVEAEATQAHKTAQETLAANRWLLGALGVAAFAILSLGLFLFTRRRALLAASRREHSTGLVVSGPNEEAWRQRALAAEARAQKATDMLRTKMLPHMARWMMQEFMQRLMWQRRAILTEQQTAEREVAELAERLENVHAPLEERLRAYECRIAELEAELAARGEQNLELIKARIETTRRKLDGERSHDPQETLNLG